MQTSNIASDWSHAFLPGLPLGELGMHLCSERKIIGQPHTQGAKKVHKFEKYVTHPQLFDSMLPQQQRSSTSATDKHLPTDVASPTPFN